MGRQSKVISAVVTGLVVILAVLAFVLVRGTSHPERPDLSPVKVTPTATVTDGTGDPNGTGSAQGSGAPDGSAGDSSGSRDGGQTPDGSGSGGDASAKGRGELQHSYEPAPNPPREVPSDGDDDDDGAGDDGDDDDDDDGGDDDDD
ncbi:hypothetical protein [Brevibacterium casei]|uniref:Uncharacterized protein n=2 Tax=Brevibacterium casei TaxID=33889 RepID=A0A449D847_9MICO|nr:hypothetical protein [Brevibacterium casei]MCT1550945.1 hypothetical protein [Brevibacterium casei]MCT1560265.1 hypothetical protein [Brevibacterium casei]MCT1764535.1 hypothetical protein [Brevibacterium casei]MCT2206693.1 hypothetical protein [Brevibacterium casei]QPR38433.1 hypothetical protein I6G94_12720 [Brevibacterium casei]